MTKKDKQKRVPLSESEKRNTYVVAKVTRAQKDHITTTAHKCGMTVSDYILSVAYGYHPKYRLTPSQQVICNEIVGVRNDIRKFFGNLKTLSTKERQEMMRRYSFIIEWGKLLITTLNKLNPIVEKLIGENSVPSITHDTTRNTTHHTTHNTNTNPNPNLKDKEL